jgi:hypothetical protein
MRSRVMSGDSFIATEGKKKKKKTPQTQINDIQRQRGEPRLNSSLPTTSWQVNLHPRHIPH